MTEIKICGLFREDDIDYVNEAKPDYTGFILNFPGSHRNITPEFAGKLRGKLSSGIRAVGVFVNQDVDFVVEAAESIGLDVIQLHGQEDEAYMAALRERTPLPLWKAFRVRTGDDLTAAKESSADRVLLDNGYGTGMVFDWTIAASFDGPFCLAGGLTPEIIPEAIQQLHPDLVDISSGVEVNGIKDKAKIIAAVRAVRELNETEKKENHE